MVEPFHAALDACSDLASIGSLFGAAISEHGFTVSACGAFAPTDTGPETHFYFHNWPSDWVELYRARNFVAVDFSVAEARRRIAPFTWLEARRVRQLSIAERQLWQTAQEWGWIDGLSVPIHGPGGYFGLVAMGAGAELTFGNAERYALAAMSVAAHERCRQIAGRGVWASGAPLSQRELECLRWVASGKTDWEIGAILGLTETTVKTHVNGARRKLRASSRAQAVARMVLSGLS